MIKCSFDTIREIYENILNKGYLKISTRGMSMYPLIPNKSKIVIASIVTNHIKVGDIIFYKSKKYFVEHQVVMKRYKNNECILITKGISGLSFDSIIKQENIIGKVISIEKPNGKVINIETRLWRIINYIIAIYSFSTGLIYQKLCSIKKTLIGNRNNRFINFASKFLRFSIFLPPKLFINFIFFAQTIKFKLKPNTA